MYEALINQDHLLTEFNHLRGKDKSTRFTNTNSVIKKPLITFSALQGSETAHLSYNNMQDFL